MIILLEKSKLFTSDPADRFAREYQVKPRIWTELLRRHWLLQYDAAGLCGYFQFKTGRKLNPASLQRWIIRSEIYAKAQHVMHMGVRSVDSSYFGKYEPEVLEELTKNMKFSDKRDSRSLV